jgi:hypothetical protein
VFVLPLADGLCCSRFIYAVLCWCRCPEIWTSSFYWSQLSTILPEVGDRIQSFKHYVLVRSIQKHHNCKNLTDILEISFSIIPLWSRICSSLVSSARGLLEARFSWSDDRSPTLGCSQGPSAPASDFVTRSGLCRPDGPTWTFLSAKAQGTAAELRNRPTDALRRLCPSSDTPLNTTFRKLDLFRSWIPQKELISNTGRDVSNGPNVAAASVPNLRTEFPKRRAV